MAKLGTATEIETAKQILADAVEKGETYAESWQTLKDSLGGNPSFKPGYWETVFRTNTQSAYMAGKLQKYEGTGAVAYQLLVIEDERTSKICRHLLTESGYGVALPVGHRFWQKYGFPPYHFNCRTSVNPIYSSQVAKTGYIVEDIPMNRFAKFKPQKGFGGNPLERGSWWDLTDNMKKQAVKFGLMDLFLPEREKVKKQILNLSEKQFGKKGGKHSAEFGLNMNLEDDRIKFKNIILDIYNNADYTLKDGDWRGQQKPVTFYIKGNDVVVVSADNDFITILKGGVNNARVNSARLKNARK